MGEFNAVLQALRQPEYVHVLLNPLPLYGMAAGSFMLILSWLLRSSREQTAALVWIALMGAITWVVFAYGDKSYDRVLSMSTNSDAKAWLKMHMERAEKFEAVFYVTAGLAVAALAVKRRWVKAYKAFSVATLFASVFSVLIAAWISHAGGQIRHSEFREPPPIAAASH